MRDKRAVTHHYDVANEFFALFLDESMTYSCAIWSRGAKTLEEAQDTKRELVCTKLALQEGERLLDVGCGWGSFAVHAAKRHGVHVTGITLSEPQAVRARQRAAEEGVADRVEIRVMDYRELARRALRRDRLDRHGRARRRRRTSTPTPGRSRACSSPAAGCSTTASRGSATASPRPGRSPSATCSPTPRRCTCRACRPRWSGPASRRATSRASGMDYAQTLREWQRRLESNHDEAVRLAGPERMRVWQVYLRAARRGFETGFTSIYQVLANRS